MGARLSDLNFLKTLGLSKPKHSPDEPKGLKTLAREQVSQPPASEHGPARSTATGTDTATDKSGSTPMSPAGVLVPLEPALGGEGPTSDEVHAPVDTAQTSHAITAQPERKDTIEILIDNDEDPLAKGPQTGNSDTGATRGATSSQSAGRPNQVRK